MKITKRCVIASLDTPYRTVLLVGLLVALSTGLAQAQKAPDAGYVNPPGGLAGTTVDVRLGIYDGTPDQSYHLLNAIPNVKLEILGPPGPVLNHVPPYWFGIKSMVNDPPLPREVRARLQIPADCPPGPIFWRVADANGSGNTGVFMVGTDPEVLEDQRSNGPQVLPELPVTVNGRLSKIEEFDEYVVKLKNDALVTCDLHSRRLGTDLRGVLEVREPSGRLIADAVDTEGLDPILTFAAKAGVAYKVTVRDLDFRGYRSSVYRLSVHSGPRVLATMPAVLKRGEIHRVEFIGLGLKTGTLQLEQFSKDVPAPASNTSSTFPYRLTTSAGTAAPFEIGLGEKSDRVGLPTEGPVTGPFAATALWVPGTSKANVAIQGTKGKTWTLRAEAMKLGSPLDLSLALIGPDGKELAQTDDATGTTDPSLSYTFPADGSYRLELTQLGRSRANVPAPFRLIVEEPRPNFSLSTLPVVAVPIGGSLKLAINVNRTGGFQGPIQLQFDKLPEGVTLPKDLTIPGTATTFSVELQAAKSAPASAVMAIISGSTTIDGKPAIRKATATVKGNLAARDPSENATEQILIAATLKPPFKVIPLEADGGRRIHRGATHLAEMKVEREAGFQGEIRLDMAATQSRHRQGIGGPVFSIPTDAKLVAYPVDVPEWLETTRTSRLALVAIAKVADGKGVLRDVLTPVSGQITMSIEGAFLKVSQSLEPWTVARPGELVRVPIRIARSPRLTGNVRVELVEPDELRGLVKAEPISLVKGQESAEFVVQTTAKTPLNGRKTLQLRATTTEGKVTATSVTTVELDFQGR